MTPLLDPVQVGEILGISPRTVNDLCNRKKLSYIQIDGKHRRFTEDMVQAFIDNQTVKTEESKKVRRIVVKAKPQATPMTETSRSQLKAEMDSF